MVDVLPIGK